jgi:hypothetical protein
LFGCGPRLAAFVTIALTGERGAAGRLVRRRVLWRIGLVWYIAVVLGMGTLRAAEGAIIAISGGGAFTSLNLPGLVHEPASYLVAGLIG